METLSHDYDFYSKLLKEHPLFRFASTQSIQSLATHCNFKSLLKGKHIIDTHNHFYQFNIITKGKLKVYNLNSLDKHFTLFILSQNDVFDVFTLINSAHHHVCYEILENLELLVCPIDYFRGWLKNNPEILNAFFRYTIKKLELLESHILDLGTNSVPSRLANLLLLNYNYKTCQIEEINDLTHDELAQLIGTSRAVLNRHLQEFKKAGIIKVTRKHIQILDIAHLTGRSHLEDPFI